MINRILATPKVRKFARELGADISNLKGSERNGRITEEDVKNFIKNSKKDILVKEAPNPEPMVRILNPWVPKWSLGLNILSKLRTDQACRNQWSEFHMEPYAVSHGRKPFWARTRSHGVAWHCHVVA